MASAAVQQLVDADAVSLDAPVDDYLPAYGVPRSVTVRDLLNQTSGFGYYQSLADARVGESYGEFSYANANYDLLGRLVESASGLSYGDYLRRNLWGPLGMADACLDGEKLAAASGDGRGGGPSQLVRAARGRRLHAREGRRRLGRPRLWLRARKHQRHSLLPAHVPQQWGGRGLARGRTSHGL